MGIMKVLQVLDSHGIGGVEKIAYYIHEALIEKGIDSYIAINMQYVEEFIKCFNIVNKNLIITYSDLNYLVSVCQIRKIIRNIKPEIIHTHARRECVWVSMVTRKKIHIRTQHMAEEPKLPVTVFEEKLLSKNVNVWVATSQSLARTYLKRRSYIDENKIKIIYNGVNTIDSSNFREEIGNCGKYCILSRLTSQKGIDLLINQVSEMDCRGKIYIDIWGDGAEKNSILQLIKEKSIDNMIKYKGYTDSPLETLKKYDVLLMPSRNEGLPLTMLESMSVGTPVAVHDVGCVKEIIKSGYNGWIIDESFSWEKFFETIQNMTPIEYAIIAEAAQATYKERFSYDVMTKQYLDLYKNEIVSSGL